MQSRQNHDSGPKHKASVEIFNRKKREEKLHGAKNEKDLQQQLAAIERAATLAMVQDVAAPSSQVDYDAFFTLCLSLHASVTINWPGTTFINDTRVTASICTTASSQYAYGECSGMGNASTGSFKATVQCPLPSRETAIGSRNGSSF